MSAARFAILALVAAGGGCALITGLDKDYREVSGQAGGGGASGVGGAGGGTSCLPDSKADCPYGGDPKTKDVGVCHAGQKICNATGQFDACKGEVLPAVKEDCSNGADDDCNGAVNDNCPCTPNSMHACFSGDPKKADVGNCKSGMQTCNMDGKGYGPCTGEVPAAAAEDCKKVGDEDCDGIACSDAVWADAFGTGSEIGKAVAFDPGKGAVYAAGVFSGMLSFNKTTIEGVTDAFLVKLDPAGVALWAVDFPGGSIARDVSALAADTKGSGVFIAGYADFGTGKPLHQVAFVEADAGKTLWSVDCGGSWNPLALAASNGGDVYVTGDFTGMLACGGVIAEGGADVFVARLSIKSGKALWVKRFGDSDGGKYPQTGTGIAVDSSDNIYLTGTYQGALSFDGVNPIGAGDKGGSAFVAKLNGKDGSAVWAWSLGTAFVEAYAQGADKGPQIAVDSFGGPTVVGEYKGTISGSPPLSNGDTVQHAFVAKCGSDGKAAWLKDVGRVDDPLVVGDAQNLVIAGTLVGTANFGGDPLLQFGSNGDLALGKLSVMNGAHVWSKRHGGMQNEQMRGLAIGAQSYTAITGFFIDQFTMDGLLLKTAGKGGLFVAKIAP